MKYSVGEEPLHQAYKMADGNQSNYTNTSMEYEYVEEFSIRRRLEYIFTQPSDVMAIVLGLTAIVLNILVLCALSQVRNRITSHIRFIVSLALSDILVTLSVFMHIVNKVVQPQYEVGVGEYGPRLVSRCCYMVIKALNTAGLNVTLLNLLLMALDHYIAIMKPLQYPVLVCRKKVIGVIILAWVISLLLGFSDFASALPTFHIWSPYGFNFCEVVWITDYQEEYITFAIAPFCFGIMVYSYSCIYWKIHKRRVPGVQEVHRRDTRRNTKALVTTLLALGTFMISWLPQCLFQISFVIKAYVSPEEITPHVQTLTVVDHYLFNLLVFNALCDPIIYTVRLQEVQLGLQKLFCTRLCGRKPQQQMTSSHSCTVYKMSTRRGHRSQYSNFTTGVVTKDTEV